MSHPKVWPWTHLFVDIQTGLVYRAQFLRKQQQKYSTGTIGQGPAAGEMSGSSRGAEMDGNQDSYLKRYYRTLPEEKRLMLEKSLMTAHHDQAQVSGLQKGRVGGSSQGPGPKKLRTDAEDNEGKESQKSSTCIIL